MATSDKLVFRDCINWSNNDHCAKSKCNYCVAGCEYYRPYRTKTFDELLAEMRGIFVNAGLHDGDMVNATLCHKTMLDMADKLERAYKRDIEPLRDALDAIRESTSDHATSRDILIEATCCKALGVPRRKESEVSRVASV